MANTYDSFMTGWNDALESQNKREKMQWEREDRQQKIRAQQQEEEDAQTLAEAMKNAFNPEPLESYAKKTEPTKSEEVKLDTLGAGQDDAAPLVQLGMTRSEKEETQDKYIQQTRAVASKLEAGAMALYQQGMIKQAQEVMKEATLMTKQAAASEKEQWALRKGHIETFANVMNQVDSQEALDWAKEQLNALEPGAGNQLPTEYNKTTAPAIRRAGLMASSALQQVEVTEKLIDLQTREQDNKSKIDHRNAETAKLRAAVQKNRDGTDTKHSQTAYDKTVDAITKEDLRYNKSLETAKLAIEKKYGPEKEPSYADKTFKAVGSSISSLWGGGADEAKPTPKQKELAAAEEAARQTHVANTTAIHEGALKKKIDLKLPSHKLAPKGPTKPTKFTKPAKPARTETVVMDGLRKANPGVSEDALRAYAKRKGYIL